MSGEGRLERAWLWTCPLHHLTGASTGKETDLMYLANWSGHGGINYYMD